MSKGLRKRSELAKTYEGQDVVARLLARLDRRRVEEDRLCAEAERDLRAGDYAGYQEKEAARWKSRKRGRGLVMAAYLLKKEMIQIRRRAWS